MFNSEHLRFAAIVDVETRTFNFFCFAIQIGFYSEDFSMKAASENATDTARDAVSRADVRTFRAFRGFDGSQTALSL